MEAPIQKSLEVEREHRADADAEAQPGVDVPCRPCIADTKDNFITAAPSGSATLAAEPGLGLSALHRDHSIARGPLDEQLTRSSRSDNAQTEGLGLIDQQARSRTEDYFLPEAVPRSNYDNHSRVTSTSTLASFAFGSVDSQYDTTSAPHSPQSQPGAIGERPGQTLSSTAIDAKPPRPTSVPTVTSNTTVRKSRDEYPRFPEQQFTALPTQHYLPPYQPHPLRTRSSHPSQSSSFSSIPWQGSRDQIATVTGAKTVGNTPAQSPGIFENKYPASRSQVDESEDSQTSTPLLHPAHMQIPKE